MNKRIDLSNTGGFPFTEGTLDFMQQSYRNALAAIAAMCGDKVIISGCVVNDQNQVSNGWIVYNGEMIPFTGGLLGTGVVVQETAASANFQDGSVYDVYFTKTAFFGTPATFNWSDLKRLNTLQETWLPGDVKEVDCNAAYIAANFDATGLGINERKGWAICNGNNGTKNRGGRVSVGYSTVTIDPNDNVWDVLYNTIGATGGEKKHTLSQSELPNIQLNSGLYNNSQDYVDGSADPNNVGTTANGTPIKTSSLGSGLAHENRPPFIVTLFIQKL